MPTVFTPPRRKSWARSDVSSDVTAVFCRDDVGMSEGGSVRGGGGGGVGRSYQAAGPSGPPRYKVPYNTDLFRTGLFSSLSSFCSDSERDTETEVEEKASKPGERRRELQQSLSDCWGSVRDKVEFAEHGEKLLQLGSFHFTQ